MENLTHCLECENEYISDKKNCKIDSFIKFKVLVNLVESFHGLLDYENALQLDY